MFELQKKQNKLYFCGTCLQPLTRDVVHHYPISVGAFPKRCQQLTRLVCNTGPPGRRIAAVGAII